MRDWLRENYGWQTKKQVWASLVFGILVAVAVLAALAQ